MAAIWDYVLDYYFVCGLFILLAFFSCLVDIVVLFSTGCSQVGIPPLSLRGILEDNLISFPHLGFQFKLHLSSSAKFLQDIVLCCRVQQWRIILTVFRSSFAMEEGFHPMGGL